MKCKYWVKELLLFESHYQLLINGSELNDNIIIAGQSLLAKQSPHVNGFQDTILITRGAKREGTVIVLKPDAC